MAQRLKTDWILFFTTLLMVCFGLVMVYSASSAVAELRYHAPNYSFALKQIGWAVVSFFVLMFCKRKNYHWFRRPSFAFAGIGGVLMLLVIVYFADPASHRWLRIGPGGIQPSEFAKPALVLFLAYFLALRKGEINTRQTLLPIGLVVIFLVGIVAIPDLGTAMVLILTVAAIFYVAGLERKYFAASLVLMLFFAVGMIAAKPYRLSRLIGFVDPDYTILSSIDPEGKIKAYATSSLSTRDTRYQARQSKIAVGSGGVMGLGLMQSRQKLLFLPESHTDYIYAVVGEETGLIGCAAVLVGFVLILWRGFRLVALAPDDFGKYLALGVTTTILVQALINMSVVLDMGPTKGIPLPLISYGGSSILSTLLCLGMLLSVSERAG